MVRLHLPTWGLYTTSYPSYKVLVSLEIILPTPSVKWIVAGNAGVAQPSELFQTKCHLRVTVKSSCLGLQFKCHSIRRCTHLFRKPAMEWMQLRVSVLKRGLAPQSCPYGSVSRKPGIHMKVMMTIPPTSKFN